MFFLFFGGGIPLWKSEKILICNSLRIGSLQNPDVTAASVFLRVFWAIYNALPRIGWLPVPASAVVGCYPLWRVNKMFFFFWRGSLWKSEKILICNSLRGWLAIGMMRVFVAQVGQFLTFQWQASSCGSTFINRAKNPQKDACGCCVGFFAPTFVHLVVCGRWFFCLYDAGCRCFSFIAAFGGGFVPLHPLYE